MTNLVFSGSSSYTLNSDGTVTLNIPQIKNNTTGGNSGSIEAVLWFTSSPYNGGSITGYQVAKYNYPNVLNGNSYYNAYSTTLSYAKPPNGTYYATLALEEYNGSGYVVDNYIDYNNPVYVGAVPLSFVGGSSFVTNPSSGTVSISVPEITNNTTATSGTVRVELWYTATPYSSGTITGYQVATVTFSGTGQLSANTYFNPFVTSTAFTAAPSGNYYATLALEEWDGSQYVLVDHMNYNTSFNNSTTASNTVGNYTTLTLKGTHAQYTIWTDSSGQIDIQDQVAGRDGLQTVANVRSLVFSDGNGRFDASGDIESIARLYKAAFARAPDAGGVDYWTGMLEGGKFDYNSIALSFVTSAEFTNTYGNLSPQAFVQQLYKNVLGRAGDASGIAYWTGMLNGGGSRQTVLSGFATSFENRVNTMGTIGDNNLAESYRLYQAAFNRTPDPSGLNYWTGLMDNGTSDLTAATWMASSAEFTAAFAGLDNTGTVNKLYQNVLHRAGDSSGVSYWVNLLNTGFTKAQALQGFADSSENRQNTAATTHDAWVYLG